MKIKGYLPREAPASVNGHGLSDLRVSQMRVKPDDYGMDVWIWALCDGKPETLIAWVASITSHREPITTMNDVVDFAASIAEAHERLGIRRRNVFYKRLHLDQYDGRVMQLRTLGRFYLEMRRRNCKAYELASSDWNSRLRTK